MVFEWIAITAILGLVLGYGVFKLHPVIGIIAAIGAFIISFGVVLSALGGAGFLSNFLDNAIVRYVSVFGASFGIGSLVSSRF
jgi:hypothetical protein